jgi:hypothetical protein
MGITSFYQVRLVLANQVSKYGKNGGCADPDLFHQIQYKDTPRALLVAGSGVARNCAVIVKSLSISFR